MGVLEFISSLAAALSWPVVAVIAVVALRRPIGRWLEERPARIKVGPVEAEWDKAVAQVKTELDQPGVPDPLALTASPVSENRELQLLAQTAPPLAIVQASSRVEEEIKRKVAAAGVRTDKEGLGAVAVLAHRAGLISQATQQSVVGLVALRNLAIHRAAAITTQEALEFVALADAVIYALNAASQIERSVTPGTTNIQPGDVAELVQAGRTAEIVAWATAPDASSVKQRQIAVPLIEQGFVDEAVQIGLHMQNRSELRTLCNAIVGLIAHEPDKHEEAWAALETLKPRLRTPQIRDVREKMNELGVQPRASWDSVIEGA